jgi:predicted Zn-dependent protease
MAARKPTPVDVIYFPKHPAAPRPVTRSAPGLDVTEPTTRPPPVARTPRSRAGERRRTKVSSSPETSHADMAALGHELFRRGRVHEARVVFEGLVVATPEDAFVHTMLGTVHLALHDLERALRCFEVALALEPDDVAARVYRGELRLHRRKLRQAAEDFTHALGIAREGDPFARRARRLLAQTSS